MATRIRAIRREREMSGVQVAKKLGISAQYYYDIEKGKRNLSAEMANKLADILGVSTDYLLGREKIAAHDKEDDKREHALFRAFKDLPPEEWKYVEEFVQAAIEYAKKRRQEEKKEKE